jgi:hypothetical protein
MEAGTERRCHRAMKKDLTLVAAVYVSCLSLVSFLWDRPGVLLAALAALSALMLLRWHQPGDLTAYAVGFTLGPLGEAMAVHFGAWNYARPFFLIPLWLPFLWGIAALFVKKLAELWASRL